ncbi:MAG: NAD(+)/NADH kinase [Oscillospiraceae bacterium]|nr:NAD(+)/NADH kinase [Oscillospiraceae bacterium]
MPNAVIYASRVGVPALTEQVIGQLKSLGCDCRVFEDKPEVFENADFAVTLGGDGTILRCAALASHYDVPILGINHGRLGFMAELEAHETRLLERAVNGDYKLDVRMMLDVAVMRDGEPCYNDTALNDAVVSGGQTSRVVELMILAQNEPLTSFLGDGVIVSTPTGSTAYAYSAGGAVIEPHIENIAITPICPHNMRSRQLILSGGSDVQVTPLHNKGHSAFLTVDGRGGVSLNIGEYVEIVRSKRVCKLIRVKDRNFYQIISEKLGGREL